MSKPVFRFKGRAVIRRDDPYYYTNWAGAQSVSVLAHTEDEADRKLIAMLSKPSRHYRWTWQWQTIEEEPA